MIRHFCLACDDLDCNCDLSVVDECGNCGGPIAFAEVLAAFIHVGEPEDCCHNGEPPNVEHLVIPNEVAVYSWGSPEPRMIRDPG